MTPLTNAECEVLLYGLDRLHQNTPPDLNLPILQTRALVLAAQINAIDDELRSLREDNTRHSVHADRLRRVL